MWRLHANAQFDIIEINTIQFEKTYQHMTKICVFNSIRITACRATAITSISVIEMIIIEIADIVTATIIIIGGNA